VKSGKPGVRTMSCVAVGGTRSWNAPSWVLVRTLCLPTMTVAGGFGG
jgi:hypothetical protein